MNKNRVVITGLGVVASNAVGIPDFLKAIQSGKSGIQFHQELKDFNFSCQIGGTPEISEEILNRYFTKLEQKGLLA
ncbi:MAG: beta-ketoacyl-[acyl-carrier-protein] synthase family protein, partial [Psychroflexus sp.]